MAAQRSFRFDWQYEKQRNTLPYVNACYAQAFPGCSVRLNADRDSQLAGVDRIIDDGSGNIVTADDKIRRIPYNGDVLIEVFSVVPKSSKSAHKGWDQVTEEAAPVLGWGSPDNKSITATYIGYFWDPSKMGLLIPHADLRCWMLRNRSLFNSVYSHAVFNPHLVASNNGSYETLSLPIPVAVLIKDVGARKMGLWQR